MPAVALRTGFVLLTLALTCACGARTGLLEPIPVEDAGEEADVHVDAHADAHHDAPADAPPDSPPECTPEVTYIYVVTQERELLAFKPESASFQSKGFLTCKDQTPAFSMAISRTGTAYVELDNGRLFAVSVFDASCKSTAYVAAPLNEPFNRFGSGFAYDETGVERLFAADITFTAPSAGLGSIDTKTFKRTFIAPFSDNPGNAAELTSGPDGHLWAYFLAASNGGTLARVDTTTATLSQETPLPAGDSASSLGVAFWKNAFYIFTGQNGTTTVTRFVPATNETKVVATLGSEVVGAAVSTCAEVPPP